MTAFIVSLIWLLVWIVAIYSAVLVVGKVLRPAEDLTFGEIVVAAICWAVLIVFWFN